MSKGRAKLAIGEGVSVWVLEAPDGFGEPGFHAHHAIQLTTCLKGELGLSTTDQRMTGRCIAVAADASHRFDARGLLAFIFVEPEGSFGRTLSAKLFGGRVLVRVEEVAFIREIEALGTVFDQSVRQQEMLAIAARALAHLAPVTCLRKPDERVARIIDFASNHLDGPLSLKTAAVGIHLSEDRLRHLFVEQTGLAFRTYLVWLRLVRAVQLYSEGSTLTEAAHCAGFSDSAHLSRVFKRTFGLPATALTRL